MPFLDMQGFSYSYPGMDTFALKDLNLVVDQGEIVSVIGLNGSGKTSLCLGLSGLIHHMFNGTQMGSVRIFNEDTSDFPPGFFTGKIGLVLQNPLNQLSRMRYTVFEEVAYGLENLGVPREQMPERIKRTLQLVGLEELQERSPYTLSGGQQQRLALASVLVMDAPILILDEPTGMLDPRACKSFYQVMKNMAETGKTIILAEQKLEKVADFATRVVLLSEGQILLDGTTHQVLTSPILAKAGINSIPVTEAANIGLERGLWPPGLALPINEMEAESGFRAVLEKSRKR